MASDVLRIHKHHSLPPPARSIRFAPLPDTRRYVYVTDDGDELPLAKESRIPPPLSVPDDASSLSSGSGSSSRTRKRNSYTLGEPLESCSSSSPPSTSGTVTPASETATAVSSDFNKPLSVTPTTLSDSSSDSTPTPKPSIPKSKATSFFRPFFRKSSKSRPSSASSSVSLTPTPSLDSCNTKHGTRGLSRFNISAEELLTLGTINLFRSVSRGSRTDSNSLNNDSSSDWSLSRWSSIASASSAPASTSKNTPVVGSTLARCQSSQSFASSSKRGLGGNQHAFAWKASSTSKPKTSKAIPRKGVRMLNGRVYGGPKRANLPAGGNPFANARDEADPEFVEWGYGGMGSVSGRSAAGMNGTRWERLHSDQGGLMIGSCDGAADENGSSAPDDGSGMGWVRKRRESREREKKARDGEERKENGQEKLGEGDTDSKTTLHAETANLPTSGPESINSCTQRTSTAQVVANHALLSLAGTESTSPAPAPQSSTYPMPAEEKHVLHAVTIPAHFTRHNHHRSLSKGSSILSLTSDGKVSGPASGQQDLRKKGSESSDDSESEDESEEVRDIEDDDEESDEELAESKRKTALGAGVEKYTRHKEVDHDGARATSMQPTEGGVESEAHGTTR
ncbi:hypothetical protein AX17_001851 [Amanita inopinata Kibby_2008]|nr:hypothetical protein AX17_001851 [Amanita inopinata Kibby_2008]